MENPRHWRLKDFRYGLRVKIGPDGKVSGDVPKGVQEYVEGLYQPQELALPAIKALADSDIIPD